MTKADLEDYYALLGVSENVGDAELRRVWRRLAKRHHPDHAGPHSTASFQRLSAAYAVLCDPVARATYDRRRRAGMPRESAAAPATADAVRRRAPSVMLSRQSGPLMALLAGGIARRVDSGLIELFLSAAEAKQGGMIMISMRVAVRCKQCPAAATVCSHCGGSGSTDELFSAWLAVRPEVPDGSVLSPSELLPGMVHPVRFVIRTRSDY
jgi:DnaJ-class molecular chaperone